MTGVVVVIVTVGIALAVGLGIAQGFDSTAVILLVFAVVFGLLAVAVSRKVGSGLVRPARCGECGGLISPNAPYCKHCGSPT